MGGHAIVFAQTREHAIAVDNGETQLRLVRHNATTYGVVDKIDPCLGISQPKPPFGYL